MKNENTDKGGGEDSRGRGEVVAAEYGRVSVMERSPQASALEQAAIADVMVGARLAQMNPRNWFDCRARILKSCGNLLFADAAIYAKPVGGEKKRGFSVRFAEECVRQLGNMKVQIAQIADFADSRVVKVTVWDMETCTSISQDVTIMKRLERRDCSGRVVISERKNKEGRALYIVEATDDELRMIENREVSFAFRNVVLRLVREDLQLEAWAACEKTIQAQVTSDPEAELKAVCDGFRGLNIMPAQLEQRLGHKLGETTPAEIMELRHDFKALRDGETTWPAIVEQAEERRAARQASGRSSAKMPEGTPTATPDGDAAGRPKRKRQRRKTAPPVDDGRIAGETMRAGEPPPPRRSEPSAAEVTTTPPAAASDQSVSPALQAFLDARATLKKLAQERFPEQAEERLDTVSFAMMGRKAADLKAIGEIQTVIDVMRRTSDEELLRIVRGR